MLSVCIPHNNEPQHPGNGNMLAICAGKRAVADKLYYKAIELGARDEGQPGERSPAHPMFSKVNFSLPFYGACVRDPDGNKLCFYSTC